MHAQAQLAAEAAREAFDQQGNRGFWRFIDLAFAHQHALQRSDLEAYAQEIGLDLTRFRVALDRHRHLGKVRDDVEAADETGADIGTPAFFVNGYFYSGAFEVADMRRIIDEQLGSAH